MKAVFVSACCFFGALSIALGWQPIVAVHDSELTRALAAMPASGLTPTNGGSTTGFQWWVTNWNYFTIAESIKETFRSDGTAYAVVGDSNIVDGQLLDTDGTPKYPILISLASEAISDQEVSELTNYVAAGGFLFIGSSSFTRNTDGTSRGDFAIASAMGLHMVNPALTNWFSDLTFTTTVDDNNLVTNIPSGTLFWEMPSSADEISWPTPVHLNGETPDAQMPGLPHLIWQVQPSDAEVIAEGDENLPYLAVKSFGKGYIIYDAAMEPLLGHGSWAPAMYAYDILHNAIAQAFQSARLPVVKLSPWPYPYDAAVMFRHDMEAIPARISLIKGAADFESANGIKGDYYFCTGTLRLDMPGESNSVISQLQQAVTEDGATIGPHNGGLTNINLYVPPLPVIESPALLNQIISEGWYTAYYPYTYPILAPLQEDGFSYDYWHWGPDEVLDCTNLPPGFTSGAQYALTSISNSFSDIAAWGLTNGTPKAWCSPYFNATRESSYQVEQQLNIKITGDDKLSPFPHWIYSSQTDGKYYSILSLPVSDWFVGNQISQSMEYRHTSASIEAMIDFYYNLGALINLYCHTSPVGDGPDSDLDNTYETYAMTKPRVWSTNATGLYYWWLARSNVLISTSFSTNTSPPQTTVSISGASDPNTTVEFDLPETSYVSLQIATNGVIAGANAYRINGQTIKLQVGNSVTNAVISYFSPPTAQNDVYAVQAGATLNVSAPGVLANDSGDQGTTLSAALVSGPANGTLSFNSDGSFTYTPTNGYTGMDGFTYEAVSDSLTSSIADVAITVVAPGEAVFDNFSRPPGSDDSIFPWINEMGDWGITNDQMIGTSPLDSYAYAYYSGGSWSNFTVQASIQFSSTSGWGGGISGRLNPNTGAQYSVWVYPEKSPAAAGNGNGVIQLLKYSNWLNYSNMDVLPLPKIGTSAHTVQLTFLSNSITVFFDGVELTNIMDDGSFDGQPAYTTGTVGLNMWTESPVAYAMSVNNLIVSVPEAVTNPGPFQITSIVASNAVATITWASVAGNNYQLLYKNALTDSNWMAAPYNISAEGPFTSATDDLSGITTRFYWIEDTGTETNSTP